jgi:hypothetical protein
MINFLENTIIFLEVITLITAITLYKKYRNNFYIHFLVYLFLALIIEFIAEFYKTNTFWIFNIYTLFEFLNIALIYYTLNKEKSSKRFIIYTSIIFYIIYFLSFEYKILQNYTVIILSLLVTPFMFLYLKELLNSNKIINYKKELPFWITVAFLIYYLGTVPFFSMLYIGEVSSRILFISLIGIVFVKNIVFIGGLLYSQRILKK